MAVKANLFIMPGVHEANGNIPIKTSTTNRLEADAAEIPAQLDDFIVRHTDFLNHYTTAIRYTLLVWRTMWSLGKSCI
ncbi:hypothetical protein J1614_004309 [Plenodomus biglobosus]|nr:hypothetical protein J1614_004309 [Plenodomus biglobosus]